MPLVKLRTSAALLIIVGIVAALSLTRAQAQPPGPAAAPLGSAFTYQGQLQNNGAPANGSYDFQFILYDAAVGGAQVAGTAIVAKSAVAVTNGQFTVPLDFGAVFGNGALFLEIGVRPAGGAAFTTLSPRQEISPAPYAQYALRAGSASSASSAQSVPWSGVTGKPNGFSTRKITIPAAAFGHSLSAAITPDQWGLTATSAAPALSFVVSQPDDWDKTTPFTVTLLFALPGGPAPSSTVNWRLQAGGTIVNSTAANASTGWDSLNYAANEDATPLTIPAVSGGYFDLMKRQSWTAKYSTTYNTWYFGNPSVGVTVANSFSDNPIWHFAFLRGQPLGNGESYSGEIVLVAAEISYQTAQ